MEYVSTVHIIIPILVIIMLVAIVMLIRSLHAKNRIQNSLTKEKEKYRSLFHHMREGLAYHEVIFDDAGKPVDLRLLDVNDPFECIIGLRREEIVNKTVTEVFPHFESYWLDGCKEVITTGRPMQFENYLKDRGLFLSVNLFEPEKGKIAIVFSDVTEDRTQREKLIAANKELIAVNTLRDRLFTVITNDVREPLALLVNLSGLLAEEMKNDSGDQREMAEEIRKQAANAFTMANNLLEWFKVKKGAEVFKPVKYELSRIVREAMQINNVRAEIKGIKIVSFVSDGVTVFVDRDMMELVLANLLSNAIKYTHRNGSVMIAVEEEKEMAVVSIKDTGVGIPPEKAQLIFQDARGNATAGTEGEMGIGVGLFLCRRLVQLNGGEIWVDSMPGEGSCFFVSIPACKQHD